MCKKLKGAVIRSAGGSRQVESKKRRDVGYGREGGGGRQSRAVLQYQRNATQRLVYFRLVARRACATTRFVSAHPPKPKANKPPANAIGKLRPINSHQSRPAAALYQ